ncbi:MAG TPA: trypsin-like peptidase domain-containing protein [Anaerolineae bacterium]|nr:trypsin-like peptidase domain-containing protein [Anaerolineae bacterium]
MGRSLSGKLLVISLLVLALSACTPSVQQPLKQAEAAATSIPAVTDGPAPGLFPEEQAFTSLYERVNPSVVNIRVVLKEGAGSAGIPDFHFDIPGFPQAPTPEAPQGPQQAQGSGFVFDDQGHLVTNNHVVAGAEKIVVTFSDGTEAAARLVGADPDSDLAVIKVDVDPARLAPVTLGDSGALKVGQIVIAIGNPFGLEGSMTTGIVSGLGRLLPAGSQTAGGQRYSIPDIIQTDASINPGNSGGPLLDIQGRVIGVNTAIESPVRANSGVGYAVPVAIVSQVVPELIKNGKVEHAYLGIAGGTLSADVARAMKLDPDQRGVLVAEVTEGGPAARAGLKGSSIETTIDGLTARVGGDVIVGIDDQTVKEFDDLLAYIVGSARVGQTVTLHILRDGQPQDIQVTLDARPGQP